MSASLLERLNITVPVIQAPMVGVSTPALAAAVTRAGGLGSIGLGASNPEQARALIAQVKALTRGAVNYNLFCHAPAQPDPACEAQWLAKVKPRFEALGATPPFELREIYRSFIEDEQMLALLVEQRPAVVSFHFGLPGTEAIGALKQAGCVLLCSVTCLQEAQWAVAAGVDGLVAQGYEAGGHRGVFAPDKDTCMGTLGLVRLLCELQPLPVIAAGGVMDGLGIRGCLALGAVAVQMGTAFIGCPESAASDAYREALTGPRGHSTAVTAAISGRPARGLVNRNFTCLPQSDLPAYPLTYDGQKALAAAAARQGSDAFAVQWAGQGAPLARRLPAAELVQALAQELRTAPSV